MKTILERIFTGELFPAEHLTIANRHFKQLCHTAEKEREYFFKNLTMEDKKRFEVLDTMDTEIAGMREQAVFSYGFSLAIRIMAEAFAGEKV